MSLKQWADNGWLKPHRTSPKEINSLLRIVERDLNDARGDISSDWRFGIAYNAALKLCRILLSAEGLKAGQKEGLGIYTMLYACLPVGRRSALCFLKVAKDRVGKIFVSYGWKNGHRSS